MGHKNFQKLIKILEENPGKSIALDTNIIRQSIADDGDLASQLEIIKERCEKVKALCKKNEIILVSASGVISMEILPELLWIIGLLEIQEKKAFGFEGNSYCGGFDFGFLADLSQVDYERCLNEARRSSIRKNRKGSKKFKKDKKVLALAKKAQNFSYDSSQDEIQIFRLELEDILEIAKNNPNQLAEKHVDDNSTKDIKQIAYNFSNELVTSDVELYLEATWVHLSDHKFARPIFLEQEK